MTESSPTRIRELNQILEDMGVHALLDDIANSPDAGLIADLPVDPYEVRLLRAAGHPKPEHVMAEYLQRAAANPSLLRDSDASLKQAEAACLKAHKEITLLINIGPQLTQTALATPNVPASAAGSRAEKPKRRKLFGSLGKLFSGLLLLSGNAVAIPTVTI